MKRRVIPWILVLFLFASGETAIGKSLFARGGGPTGASYTDFLAGYMEYRAGNFDAALEWYKKALKAAPNNPDILYEVANVQVKKGKIPEAKEILQKLLDANPTHANARLLFAGVLAAAGDNAGALREYERAAAEDSQSEEAHLQLAVMYVSQNQISKAEETLSDLIEKKPGFLLGYYYRGRIRAGQKKLELALSDFDRALQISPGFGPALLDSGIVLEALSRQTEAEERYREALQSSPDDMMLRERLGRLLVQEKKIDQAVNEYEELKKVSPASAGVRLRLGILYMERDMFDQAISEFEFVLKADPTDASARFFLGVAYESKGAGKEAAQAFRMIPADSSYYRDAQVQLSLLLSREERWDEAIDILKSLRQQHPEDADLLILLGGLMEEAKRYEEALALLEEATKKAPDNAAAWFSLGVVSDKLHRESAVVSSMEKVIAINPKHATALNYLGYTFAERNIRLDEAEKLILRALEVRPEDGYFIDSLAWVYYRRGDFAKAERTQKKAMALVADDPTMLEHMGDILAAQGKNREAAVNYEKAIAKGHEKKDDVAAKLKKIRSAGSPRK